MTPSDAQRIERLINQLRKDARLFPSMESIRKAADEIERLRGVEEQWRASVKCYLLGLFADMPQHVRDDIVTRTMKTFEQSIAAFRSTGAADVGEEHE